MPWGAEESTTGDKDTEKIIQFHRIKVIAFPITKQQINNGISQVA